MGIIFSSMISNSRAKSWIYLFLIWYQGDTFFAVSADKRILTIFVISIDEKGQYSALWWMETILTYRNAATMSDKVSQLETSLRSHSIASVHVYHNFPQGFTMMGWRQCGDSPDLNAGIELTPICSEASSTIAGKICSVLGCHLNNGYR